MEPQPQWVGIDVSKASLDVYLRLSSQSFQLLNQTSGIAELVERLQSFTVQQVILEATGGLELASAQALQAQGFAVSGLTPGKGETLLAPMASWQKQIALMPQFWLILEQQCSQRLRFYRVPASRHCKMP